MGVRVKGRGITMSRLSKMCVLMCFLLLFTGLVACGDDTEVMVPVTVPNSLLDIVDNVAQTENFVDEEQEETVSEENTEDEVITITISMAGDVTLGMHQNQDYYNSFRKAYDEAEDESYFFENVSDIFSNDDMTIVNLEGVLTLSDAKVGDKLYYLKGDPDYAYLMNPGSIEVVSMANNHRLDFGQGGSDDTVEAVTKAGIIYAYDDNVAIYETKGISIGIISVNVLAWGSGVEKFIQNGIEILQEKDVDLIIACCHWGKERENYPGNYQTTLGRKCIDWGVDVVIGHHPHVLQGIEEYNGKYIMYSLGNFCFGANRNPNDKDTIIAQQTFTFINGEIQENNEMHIIPCSVSSVTNRNDFKPTPAVGEEAQRIINRMNEYSKDFGVEFNEEGYIK